MRHLYFESYLTLALIIDTGGSGQIDVDPRILAYYYENVPGSVLVNDSSSDGISYNFPCNATLPDLTLYIGNGTAIYRSSLLKTYTIDPANNSKPFPQNPLLTYLSHQTLTLDARSVHRPPKLFNKISRPAWKYGRGILRISFRGIQPGRAGGVLCAVATVPRYSGHPRIT